MDRAGAIKRSLALVALSAGAALLAVACAGPQDLGPGQAPLLDPPSQLQVLVESRLVALPPASTGNRFVAGWRSAGAAAKRSVVADASVSRLEAVNLSNEERTLVLAFDGPPHGVVRARIGDGAWRTVSAADRTEITLPAPLSIGRVPIELALPPNAPSLQAALSPALPAGEVRVGARAIVQGGASLVEIVRPLRGHTVVTGELELPSQPRDGQVLELRQRCDGKDELLWRWQPRWWDSLRRPAFRVKAGCSSGWLHLRFLAPLPGPAATWRRLSLNQPAPDTHGNSEAPTPAPTAAPSPPPAYRLPRLVLVYVFDALRSDAVGKRVQGRSTTPVLDEIAANGVSFEQHLALAPSTLPSTKALFTGRPWRRRGGVRLGPDLPTLAEAFRAAGYRTGLFSGNVYVSRAFGMDRGFEVAPEDTLADEEELGAANDNAARVNAAAATWIRSLPPDAKAFLYLHVIHPHNPYQPPGHVTAVAGSVIDGSTRTLLDIVHRRRQVTAADQARITALYHANLAYADAQFGNLLTALRERFPANESLVVATSDHGEELFDHGGLLHGYTLYDEQIRIPLVLSWPRTIAPRRIRQPTSTLHLHQALRDIARNRSAPLAALLTSAPRPFEDDVHLASAANVRGGIFAARSRRWKVIWAPRTGQGWGMGAGLGRGHDAELVFDLSRDPQERHNLAGSVDDPEVLWLRARLQSWAMEPDAEADAEDSYDAETRARLRALGYVQ